MVVSTQVDDGRLHDAVVRSLDRKVCNTLNTCCLVKDGNAAHRAAVVLTALQQAGAARGQFVKLHVAAGSEALVPSALFTTQVPVVRSAGPVNEPQAEIIDAADLGVEWEWEDTPEVTLVAVDSLDKAMALFNRHSPRLVGTLISKEPAEHRRFLRDARRALRRRRPHALGGRPVRAGQTGAGAVHNWEDGRLFGRGGVLTGDSVYTVRTRYRSVV